MELGQLLSILRKWLWLILACAFVFAAAAYLISESIDPVYEAKVTMMIDQPGSALFANLGSLSTGEDLALTYSKLLTTRPLLELVIANLDLPLTPDDLVEDMITTNLIRGTKLLELTVRDSDPKRASDIANEAASMFISLNNAERQLQDIADLEESVVMRMGELERMIERNRSIIEGMDTGAGFLVEDERQRLESTLSSQQSALALLLGTYLDIRSLQTQLLDVTIVEPAVPPAEPSGRSSLFYTVLGVFVGVNLGGGSAFLIEYLDRSFGSSDDVRQILGIPTLGEIPQYQGRERKSRLITLELPRSVVSEAYRGLRTSIRFAAVDRQVTTVLIASSEAGEGKTSVASNLAVVCASAGMRVVLVDADLRVATVHDLFGAENHRGLTDLLVGDAQSVSDCMVGTKVDSLHLVASGAVPPNPSELLGSKKMESVLAQLAKSADLVILDTPPVLAVGDARVLASKVDGVILTVEAKRTSHEAARQTLEALQSVGATVMGAVLNKVKTARRRSAYHYYAVERSPRQTRNREG